MPSGMFVPAAPSKVQLPPLGRPLLPPSSSLAWLCPSRRPGAALAAARASGNDWYSGGSSSSSSNQDSDSRKKSRSRHYYDSTPRYKSKGDTAAADGAAPSVSDAVADALSASFGGIDISSSRSSSNSSSRSSSSRGRGGGSSSRGRSRGGVSTADYIDDLDDEEEEEEEGRGWWEVPREQRWGQSAAAAAADPAALQLEPWQEEQLLLAAASSKKKMQVQTVAANVGLDRTEVLAWVSAFRAKPKAEQAKLLAPLQQQITRMRAQQEAQAAAAQAAEAARRGRSQQPNQQQYQQQQDFQQQEQQYQQQQQQQQQRVQQQQQGLPFSGKGPDTGFLPFSERRAAGAGRGKRLSGEVLRTLEGVYARSPWPNKEVVAGLFDLHRIPRDTVMDWFAARRQMDNLPDNPRAAKQLAATAKRALDAVRAEPLLPPELLPQPRAPKQQLEQPVPAAAEAGAALKQPQQQQERVRVQSMTAREMAALRSAMPSPRKQKGEKLKQELGVKAGPDAKQVEIAGVTFVAKDGAAGWRRAWRRRRSAAGVPAQQLDFNLWLLRNEQPAEAAAE